MKKIIIDNTRDLGIFTAISFSGVLENGIYYLLSALIILLVNSLIIPFCKKMCKRIFKHDKMDHIIEDELGKVRDKIIDEISKNSNRSKEEIEEIKKEKK